MTRILLAIAWAWLVLFLVLFGKVAGAEESSPVKLQYFGTRTQKFLYNRDPYTPDRGSQDYVYRAATEVDVSLWSRGFMENEVHMEAIERRPYTVGWHWFLGAHLTPQLDLLWEHHSRHVMDAEPPVYEGKEISFPVEDSYGIRFRLYGVKQ